MLAQWEHPRRSGGFWQALGNTQVTIPHCRRGLMPESEGEKTCTCNNETTSEPSYCLYGSAFPPSLAQRAVPGIRCNLPWGCPPSSLCPGGGHHSAETVSSFLPGTQIAKAHYKPSAGLLEHVASSQHGQSCPVARELAHLCSHHLCHFTRALLGISTLPFAYIFTYHSRQHV